MRTRSIIKLGAWGLLALGLAPRAALAQTAPAVDAGRSASPSAKPGSAVIVPINGTQKLSLTSKKLVRSVINEKEAVARIQPIANDPYSVLVVGLTAGSTKVTLTDVDGKTETFDVLVQLDIDAVKSVIRLTFPSANVLPIAAGNNTIVLTGNVAHPEEIEPILRVARGVMMSTGGGAEVHNAMTVGGVRQVQLDVTIAQVNRTEARFRNTNIVVNGSTVSFASILPGLLQPSSASSSSQLGSGVGIVPFPGQAIPLLSTGTAGSNLIFGVVPANFHLLIQALRTEGLAKLLAEPKLVTMSGYPAVFLAGGEQAVLGQASGINGPGVVLQPVGTALTFLPIVLQNNKIFLEVNPEVRSVDNALGINTSFGFTPGFSVQRIATRVTMEAGQTLAIGGLIQTATQTSANKIPVIGDVPFVGTLFSSITHTEQEQELVVLVTPYLVDAMDCKQAPCKLPGTETRKPDDFELFLETILEAPRGQREVFPGKKYVPAWKNSPSADKFPCGGVAGGCANGCASGSCPAPGGCASGNCGGVAVSTPPAPVAPVTPASLAGTPK